MPELVTGTPLWTGINPNPPEYPSLPKDESCDVAVVGGGITGALVAYHLSQAGIDTVLVDANRISRGSTSVSTSILQYEVDYDITGLSKMIGTDNAVKAFKLCESALRDIQAIVATLDDDCGFTPRNCLYYTDKSANKAAMEQEYMARKHNGFDVEFLDAAGARDRFSFPLEAGILSHNLGAEIDPFRFTHSLIRASISRGMRVYENTDCTAVDQDSKGIILRTASGKTVRAKRVAIAMGYESRKFAGNKIADLKTTFAIATKPVQGFSGWEGRCIIRNDATSYTYMRTTHDDRIIFGGRDSGIIDGDGTVAGSVTLPYLADRRYEALEKDLKTMFPGIHGIGVEYRFAGLFADTKDGLPYIGELPGKPGIRYCMCFGSNGILYAVLAGRIARDSYNGSQPEGLDLFAFGR